MLKQAAVVLHTECSSCENVFMALENVYNREILSVNNLLN